MNNTSTEICTGNNNDTWEVFRDSAGEWRWRHSAPNGQIIGAASEGYLNKDDCISNAQRNGMDCTPQ